MNVRNLFTSINRPWSQGILLYMVSFGLLSTIIFATPGFLGNDDYYHARLSAQIIEQRRLAVSFPWLPETILSPGLFSDHHLLFHLYVAPWMALGGMTGAKLATVSIAAGVVVAGWLLLRQLRVSYAWGWALGMFGLSAPFLHRLLMVRTQGASLLLLIITLMLLFNKRYRWLVVAAFAYTWLYDGFILILAFAGVYMLAAWISDHRWEWRAVMYMVIGIGLGLIINPYFPQNIQFIADHLGAKVDFGSGVRVGSEWYPYDTDVLLSNSGGALLLLGMGMLTPSFVKRRRDRIENALMLVALLTLFMVLRSRRFIEYFPAFALLFCAASWGRSGAILAEWVPDMRFQRLWAKGGQPGTPHREPVNAALSLVWKQYILIAISLIALVFLGFTTLSGTYRTAQTAESVEYMAGAARWLETHTPAGTMVFQTDWDDFTNLFYYNTANTYLVGLDPTYLELANPALWRQWVEVTRGRVPQPSQVIRQVFKADYVVSDTRHDAFEAQTRDDPHMELVYRDRYSYVWRLLSADEAS